VVCHEGYVILKGVEIKFNHSKERELFMLTAFHLIWWLFSYPINAPYLCFEGVVETLFKL
jgi:hypothetical protein